MLQGLILIDGLFFACWEKNEKKRKEKWPWDFFFFSPGLEPDTPCYLCQAGFLWLLGAIKG
jgi:hypothetical protein